MGIPKETTRDGHGERLARLEQAMEHVATKADIEGVRALIVERETVTLRWLVGVTSMVAVTIAIAIVRTFAG